MYLMTFCLICSAEQMTQTKSIPGDCLQEEGGSVDIRSAAVDFTMLLIPHVFSKWEGADLWHTPLSQET